MNFWLRGSSGTNGLIRLVD